MDGEPHVGLKFNGNVIAEAFEYSQKIRERFADVPLHEIAVFEGVSILYTDTTAWGVPTGLEWIETDNGRHPVVILGFHLTPDEQRAGFFHRLAQIQVDK